MKEYAEPIGALIGAFLGGIIAGIAVYYTSSFWCCLIVPAGYLAGLKIGKAVSKM